MDIPNLIGLGGALISGYAYLPQIIHLYKEHCTAGISRHAFLLWLVSSILLTINAVYIQSIVFIILGTIQILAIAIIIYLSTKYKDGICEFHAQEASRALVTKAGPPGQIIRK